MDLVGADNNHEHGSERSGKMNSQKISKNK